MYVENCKVQPEPKFGYSNSKAFLHESSCTRTRCLNFFLANGFTFNSKASLWYFRTHSCHQVKAKFNEDINYLQRKEEMLCGNVGLRHNNTLMTRAMGDGLGSRPINIPKFYTYTKVLNMAMELKICFKGETCQVVCILCNGEIACNLELSMN